MTKRLRITLWSCCRTEDPDYLDRVVRVLNYCTKLFLFEHVVLFTFLEPTRNLPRFVELVQIPPLDIDQFNIFVNKIAPRWLMRYPHAMSVHEDGFILRPDLWADNFLHYDYIGAPWSDGVVGNGGFSIESYELLRFKTEVPFYKRLKVPFDGRPFLPSDAYLCRTHRKFLEVLGFKFAPYEVAAVFSVEQVNSGRSFGFHGRNCQPALYAEGWQTIKESERA